MRLDNKALVFIRDALKLQLEKYQRSLGEDDLDEDKEADLINDFGYVEALLKAIEEEIEASSS